MAKAGIFTARPTCGHEAITYHTIGMAKAHAQAHADRSGKRVHITKDVSGIRHLVHTAIPKVYGPYIPCNVDGVGVKREVAQ